MDQRMYSLVTRSAAFLILALFAAPVWDAWRYRGLADSGGAAFPVGAIMPGRRPPAHPPTAQAASNAATSTVPPAVPAGGTSTTAPTADAATAVPPPATSASGARPSSGQFEAWSARAQIDPFWDGVSTTRRPAAVRAHDGSDETGDPGQGGDDLAAIPAKRQDPAAGRRVGGGIGKSGPQGQRSADGDPGGGKTPPQTGEATQGGPVAGAIIWAAGASPPPPTPSPQPDPVNAPAISPARLPAPPPAPGDPDPVVVPVPLVSALVSTPDVAPGDTILVTVRIKDADRMTSLPFHLGFDSDVIEYEGSQAGSALSALEPILLASVSPSRPGDLAVGLSLVESVGVFSGTGDLVTLRFRALAAGASDFSFSRATLRGARSEAVEVRFSDGAVTVH
jgi:cohesin domain-containing protein